MTWLEFPENNQEVKSVVYTEIYKSLRKITWFVQSHPANTCEFSGTFILLTFKLVPC